MERIIHTLYLDDETKGTEIGLRIPAGDPIELGPWSLVSINSPEGLRVVAAAISKLADLEEVRRAGNAR